MFHESSCGCIWSIKQGRVRICSTHRIEKGDGLGGWEQVTNQKLSVNKRYPANGMMVANWSGK